MHRAGARILLICLAGNAQTQVSKGVCDTDFWVRKLRTRVPWTRFGVQSFYELELLARVQSILRLNRFRKLMKERANFAHLLEAKNRQLRELAQRLVEL